MFLLKSFREARTVEESKKSATICSHSVLSTTTIPIVNTANATVAITSEYKFKSTVNNSMVMVDFDNEIDNCEADEERSTRSLSARSDASPTLSVASSRMTRSLSLSAADECARLQRTVQTRHLSQAPLGLDLVAHSSLIDAFSMRYDCDRLDDSKGKLSSSDINSASGGSGNGGNNNNGLPDLINQKNSSDKARKYLEGIDGVKFNEVQVPDNLKKQLEYFDRDELLQLIAYQKKYLDYKESRIKDLENYIDNLIVKIIETEPLILMNASNVLSKGRNLI